MFSDFDAFVYLPGDNYTYTLVQPFLAELSKTFGKDVVFIQLIENENQEATYPELRPKAYSDYILKHLDMRKQYVFIGSSSGTLHVSNFAHFYPGLVHALVLIEPTIAQAHYKFLHQYEQERGNGEWLEELKKQDAPFIHGPASEKVIDINVSMKHPLHFLRSIPVIIINTFYNNMKMPYTEEQIESRKSYIKWLRSKGHTVISKWFNTHHCIDTEKSMIRPLVNFIKQELWYFLCFNHFTPHE